MQDEQSGDGGFATDAQACRAGLAVALSTPLLILFASAAGFGALAQDAGLPAGNANVMIAALFALPAQVVWSANSRAAARCWGRFWP